jgi:hypothetical protein
MSLDTNRGIHLGYFELRGGLDLVEIYIGIVGS